MKKILGFTLIEMAVVLAIIGLLLGGLLVTLSAQVEQRKFSDTNKRLEDIKEALLGFAAANGRLPCPATSTSNGVEAPIGGSILAGAACTTTDGFVPAVTLGLTPTDGQGYILDGWETTANRIRYAVTNANSGAFTAAGGMRSASMTSLSANSNTLLQVCAGSTTITTTTCGTAITLTKYAPVVIYSLGRNTTARANDEMANSTTVDVVFVSHEPTTDFDDMVTWLSLNTVFNRMIAAGQLP